MKKHTWQFVKTKYCIILFLLLAAAVFLPELTGSGRAADDSFCSLRIARTDLQTLKKLAVEHRSARRMPGPPEILRMHSWLEAKAEYALWRGQNIESPDRKLAHASRQLVRSYCGLLLMASHQLAQGMPSITEEKGSRLRGYISGIDGSLQTYSVGVPPVYDQERSWPLIVSMHGHGWFRPFQGHPAPVYRGAVVLSPQGRGATDYKALGEEDVLAAIAEVKRDFNIDPDRIYLTGGSMGGTGAFHLGVHYADQFAAIFPIVGNADHHAWTKAWGWNRQYSGRSSTLRDWLQNNHSAVTFAGNLQHLPTYIISGAGDTIVPPDHSRNMAEAMRHLGYRVEYREFPDGGHGGFSKAALEAGLAWTCSWKRNPFPREIRWKAASLRHGKAYWLRMEQMSAPLQTAEIQARVSDGNQIEIHTQNLLSFSIYRSRRLFDARRPLFLRINGERVIFPPRPDALEVWLTVCHDPIHGWDWKEHLMVQEPRKIRGLEGPVQDALMSPFIVIVGTRSPVQGMNTCWQREARQFQKEWERRNNAPCMMVDDVQCTPELAEGRNLILFGGPRDNLVSELLGGGLPLQEIYEPLSRNGAYEERDDSGMILTYPAGNYSPGRLMVMLAANTPLAADQIWGRFGNWFNWGVYDSKKYFDYALFDGKSSSPETMLLLGWFGTDWRVQSGRYFIGNPDLRRLNGFRGMPKYDSVLQGLNVMTLPLTDLRPVEIDQMRGSVGWNTTFWGRKVNDASTALGIRAPAKITFKLNRQFRKFSARAAMDNSPDHRLMTARKNSEKVRFILWGDGLKKGEIIVSWLEPEKALSADISGVSTLILETIPAGGPSWLHSGAVWKDPVIMK